MKDYIITSTGVFKKGDKTIKLSSSEKQPSKNCNNLNEFLEEVNKSSVNYTKSSVVYIDKELHEALLTFKTLISSSKRVQEKLIISNLTSKLIEIFITKFKDDFKDLSSNKTNKFIDF